MFSFGCTGRWLVLLLMVFPINIACADESEPETAVEPPAAVMTLDSATVLAESINPILAQSAADVEAARGKALQVGLYPNPIAQGGATQAAGNESQYYFGLSQEIVTKHKLQLNRTAAQREVYQAELAFVRNRFALLTAVRQGYFVALASQRRVEVLTKLLEITKKSAEASERLQIAGETARADSLLFEIEVEKAEVALENSQAQLTAARKQLAAIIGLRDLNVDRLVGNLKVSLNEALEPILIEGYLPYNAEVQIAEQEVDKARTLLRRAQVEPFPNVTVYGGYQYQVVQINNMGLFSASVPLPLWNRNQGNIATGYAHIQKASAHVAQTQNQIARQMADLIGRYRVADQQVYRYEERIIPKAREGVTITQEAFILGQFNSFRLLQSQRGLVESNLGYISALEARFVAAAELAGLTQLEVFP